MAPDIKQPDLLAAVKATIAELQGETQIRTASAEPAAQLTALAARKASDEMSMS